MTQKTFILKYYKKHAKRVISTPEAVDWAIKEWYQQTGKSFRDPDRAIRSLHQEGKLIKINKDMYQYNLHQGRALNNFTAQQKKQIMARDNYRCVICGKGQEDGIELQIDHIKPRDKGGRSVVSNGQTLCSQHNFKKKNYNQTETGKKMFIRLLELAQTQENHALSSFCLEVLEVYEKHGINSHIKWKKNSHESHCPRISTQSVGHDPDLIYITIAMQAELAKTCINGMY